MHACPCGYLGDKQKSCTCSSLKVQNYRVWFSGHLLDRFDLRVPGIRSGRGETSRNVRERVLAERTRQWVRLGGGRTNVQMGARETKEFCLLTHEATGLLGKVFQYYHFSARAHDRVLGVARTIADLAKFDRIASEHLAEALRYRTLDQTLER
ncbi:MAG: magnesium chelatase subunit ChlI family protein [Desulfitobacteriaceae bacterium]